MAATGGPPPPPDRMNNFSGSNGNSPPSPNMLHVTTSSSDALLPSQPVLVGLHFLSAKNSTELHKRSIERKHSLPATFKPEDYERLTQLRAGEGSASSQNAPGNFTGSTRKSRRERKSVVWADQDGGVLLHQAGVSNSTEVLMQNFGRSESTEEMDIENSEYMDRNLPPGYDLLNPNDMMVDRTPEDGYLVRARSSTNLVSTLEQDMTSMSQERELLPSVNNQICVPYTIGIPTPKFRPNQMEIDDELPLNLFDVNCKGSQESISFKPGQEPHYTNIYEGFAPGLTPMDVPRSVRSEEEDDNSLYEIGTNINPICTSPLNGQMTEIPNYPPVNTPSFQCTPLRRNSAAHDRAHYGNNYDDDDEYLEPDKTPLYIPSANELPTPDPPYVSKICSQEQRSMIAKVYKKDCRTWLWKSTRQRQARLEEQEQEKDMEDPSMYY